MHASRYGDRHVSVATQGEVESHHVLPCLFCRALSKVLQRSKNLEKRSAQFSSLGERRRREEARALCVHVYVLLPSNAISINECCRRRCNSNKHNGRIELTLCKSRFVSRFCVQDLARSYGGWHMVHGSHMPVMCKHLQAEDSGTSDASLLAGNIESRFRYVYSRPPAPRPPTRLLAPSKKSSKPPTTRNVHLI